MDLLHTFYKLASQNDYAGQPNDTTIYTPAGVPIATVPARFAYELSLEGSGKLSDGRVVNYSSSGGTCQTPPGYHGVRSCYRVLDPAVAPWGMGHGVPVEPLRSIAVDPSVIPWNTTVYIREFDGMDIPSIGGVGGFRHNGLFRAEDSGGGIRGNHIDIYAGPTAMYRWLDQHLPTSYPNGSPLTATLLPQSAAPPRNVGGASVATGTTVSGNNDAAWAALALLAMSFGSWWWLRKNARYSRGRERQR